MDTRFLETFLMAVDNGSIAEAARRLNLTAAAVAKRIRALENEIGTALLSRSGRTIRPTEAGAAIVERDVDNVRRAVSLAIDHGCPTAQAAAP